MAVGGMETSQSVLDGEGVIVQQVTTGLFQGLQMADDGSCPQLVWSDSEHHRTPAV